jgi:endonuclease-3
MDLQQLVDEVSVRLRDLHPDATTELEWQTPFQLLIATILAAQCTDKRVNEVTRVLFVDYPSPEAFANAPLEDLEAALKPTGFYRQKARSVQQTCRLLIERHGGEVPRTMDELTALAGVARKTANMVLGTAMEIRVGLCTDTHVNRVSQRLGLVPPASKVDQTEEVLMTRVPRDDWTWFGHAMTLHGRYVCVAKNPKCDGCPLEDICARAGV